ncbi:hypothetical protein ACT7CY_23500 [Bacillus pacificus]
MFTVFDQQDSGNISFGIIENGKRYFLKYAGARNLEYKGKIEDAIQRLMKAKEVYEQIQHPLLVPYINPIQMQNGFCLKFHWIDGNACTIIGTLHRLKSTMHQIRLLLS